MITINAFIVDLLGHEKPKMRVLIRGANGLYKKILWPADKPLNKGMLFKEVAKLLGVKVRDVRIKDTLTIPTHIRGKKL